MEILNLFTLGTTKIVTRISLYKCSIYIKGNWNKVYPDSNQKNDESNETNLDTEYKDI